MTDTVPSPVHEPANTEGFSGNLVDQFLNRSLDFQKESSAEVSTPVENPTVVDNKTETFEEQSARMGWNAPPSTAVPAPAPGQPVPELDAQGKPVWWSELPTFKTIQRLDTNQPSPDYTGLNNGERKMFQSMPKQAYALLRPIYEEFKKIDSGYEARQAKEAETAKLLEELKGQQFYGLPDAWKLDPEIQPIISAADRLSNEANFWKSQLTALESGEKIQKLYATPDGKITVGEPVDPQPGDRAELIMAMQKAVTLQNQVQGELTGRVQNFKARYQTWDNQVETVNKEIFGRFDKDLAPHREKMMESWPLAVRHQPIYRYATDATIMLGNILTENAALKQKLAGQTLNNPARASASPNAVAASSGHAVDLNASLNRLARLTGRIAVVP